MGPIPFPSGREIVAFLVMALVPPPFLQDIVFYAIGGLASCFLIPLMAGLYWQRANHYGAIASVVVGTVGYMLIASFTPRPFGVHDVTYSLVLALVAMVVVSLITPKPSRDVIEAFWGGSAKPIQLYGRAAEEAHS